MPKGACFLQQRSIHIERDDSGAANGRAANQSLPIAAPAKMPVPIICARIEQAHTRPGAGINFFSTISFGLVTVRTGEAQVLSRRLPTSNAGNVMITMEGLADDSLWRVAILTPLAGA